MTGSSSFSSSLFRRPCGHRSDNSLCVSEKTYNVGGFSGLTETLVSAHQTPRHPLQKPEEDEKNFSAC